MCISSKIYSTVGVVDKIFLAIGLVMFGVANATLVLIAMLYIAS